MELGGKDVSSDVEGDTGSKEGGNPTHVWMGCLGSQLEPAARATQLSGCPEDLQRPRVGPVLPEQWSTVDGATYTLDG